MTPDEAASIDQQIPGFSQMSPEQQDALIQRLHLRAAAGQVQQKQGGGLMQAAPIAGGLMASKLFGGGSAASPVGSVGPGQFLMSDGTIGAPSAFSMSGIGTAGNALLPVAGAIGTVDTLKRGKGGLSGAGEGAASGAAMGSYFGPEGALIGAGVGGVVGGLNKKTGKDKDQQNRDEYRKVLQNAGIYDKDFNLTLSDGTRVNMGLDGGTKNYNVDFSQKGIGDIVALANPFAQIVTRGDPKLSSDLAGEITNAIKGSKDPAGEVRALFQKAGISKEAALQAISQLQGDPQAKQVWSNTINQLGLQSAQGGQGGSINMSSFRMPTFSVPKVDNTAAVRSNLLNSLLAQNTRPLQYPRSAQNGDTNKSADNFNSTLTRIVGGGL